ncbi:MAG: glutaredoxin family protein [Thiobacillus sp.]|nr:glutaredoxin family protein [Thiobacillus sp.]
MLTRPRTLTLYTRAGCPLCEDMATDLGALIAAAGHRVVPVDVDADPALKARYGWDVPLLFDGDTEICRHQLNLPALREWLDLNSGPG